MTAEADAGAGAHTGKRKKDEMGLESRAVVTRPYARKISEVQVKQILEALAEG